MLRQTTTLKPTLIINMQICNTYYGVYYDIMSSSVLNNLKINVLNVQYKTTNKKASTFTTRIITHKIIKPAVKTYAHLHTLHEKTKELKGCACFGS